jgi:phosphohistidine swiveling domain-containing protein
MRAETQEYNEAMQEIFEIALTNWYPHLGKKAHFVLPQEVWSGTVKDTAILDELEERSKGFVFYNEQLFTGSDVDLHLKKLNIVLEKEGDDQMSEFSGQIAQSGKIQGTVRLVITKEDLNKVTSDDVLVTAMTMPAYLPAMKKAVAFVTDEGGITCHAAIIAREMNKPCIIGTRVATKVLKDGDLIEVDADKGIVKILKRS